MDGVDIGRSDEHCHAERDVDQARRARGADPQRRQGEDAEPKDNLSHGRKDRREIGHVLADAGLANGECHCPDQRSERDRQPRNPVQPPAAPFGRVCRQVRVDCTQDDIGNPPARRRLLLEQRLELVTVAVAPGSRI